MELAADDFGTGFASYANLQLLPYTVIKIDRKLISGLTEGSDARARIQIRSIVEMAHAAGMTVVAEGIEGGEQVAFLRLLGCDVGQGFYFSRPVPPLDAERLLVTPGRPTSACRPDALAVGGPGPHWGPCRPMAPPPAPW